MNTADAVLWFLVGVLGLATAYHGAMWWLAGRLAKLEEARAQLERMEAIGREAHFIGERYLEERVAVESALRLGLEAEAAAGRERLMALNRRFEREVEGPLKAMGKWEAVMKLIDGARERAARRLGN